MTRKTHSSDSEASTSTAPETRTRLVRVLGGQTEDLEGHGITVLGKPFKPRDPALLVRLAKDPRFRLVSGDEHAAAEAAPTPAGEA